VIRALLFDFDGTLVDTESVDLRVWREVFDAHGVELPVDRFALRIGTLNGPDGLDELDALLDEPCNRAAVSVTRRARELELVELEQLRPGVGQLLDEAKASGVALAIVSSSTSAWVRSHLRRLDLEDGWDAIVCADGDTARCKPSPALYREALDVVGVEAAEAIAIEDSPNGIAAARAAGIFCMAVPNAVTSTLDLSDADVVVDTFEGLSLVDLLARVP
jgi:HAD superfamily hydrolase (TIGR01509 family)